jgi:hypothetical protein
MSETATIKAKWVEHSVKADEIWIPTEFHRCLSFIYFRVCFYLPSMHREAFTTSGVTTKLTVIEESLDTTMYDPEHTVPLPLSDKYHTSFKFLSVFKWEDRKGWDVLLQAYFEVRGHHPLSCIRLILFFRNSQIVMMLYWYYKLIFMV